MAIFEPDLFLSIRFAKIFREEIIQIPKLGILNLHSAILPDYRGILGTLHNLKLGKSQYGCTLHYINSRGIDTGEIVAIAQKEVDKNRSLLWHVVTLYPMGVDLIAKCLEQLQNGQPLSYIEQDPQAGAYFSVPTEADFKQLKTQGFTIATPKDFRDLLADYIHPQLSALPLE